MGKVELVLKSESENDCNKVNSQAITKSMADAEVFLSSKGFAQIKEIDWKKVKEIIHQGNISEAEYYRWIDLIVIQDQTEHSVKLKAPYREAAIYVKTNYDTLIKNSIKKLVNHDVEVIYGYN